MHLIFSTHSMLFLVTTSKCTTINLHMYKVNLTGYSNITTTCTCRVTVSDQDYIFFCLHPGGG